MFEKEWEIMGPVILEKYLRRDGKVVEGSSEKVRRKVLGM